MAEVRSANYPGNLYTCKFEFKACIRNADNVITGYAKSFSSGAVSVVSDDPDSLTAEVYRLIGVADWVNQNPQNRVSAGALTEYAATFTGKTPVVGDSFCTVTELVRKDAENSKAIIATRLITTPPGQVSIDTPHYYVADMSSTNQLDWRYNFFYLSWTPPLTGDPVDYYTIYRNDPRSTVDRVSANIQVGTSTDTSIYIEDIDTVGDYIFAITAHNRGGASEPVASSIITVPETHYTIYGAKLVSNAPTHLSPGDDGVDQVKVYLDRKLEFDPDCFRIGNIPSSSIGVSSDIPYLRMGCFSVTGSSSSSSTTTVYPIAISPGNPISESSTDYSVTPGHFVYTLSFTAGDVNWELKPRLSISIDGCVFAGNNVQVSDPNFNDDRASVFLAHQRLNLKNEASRIVALPTDTESPKAIGLIWGDSPYEYAPNASDPKAIVSYGSITYPDLFNVPSPGSSTNPADWPDGSMVPQTVITYIGFTGFKFGVYRNTDDSVNNNVCKIGISRQWADEGWGPENILWLKELTPAQYEGHESSCYVYGTSHYYAWCNLAGEPDWTEIGRAWTSGMFGYDSSAVESLASDRIWLKRAFWTGLNGNPDPRPNNSINPLNRIKRALTVRVNLYGPHSDLLPLASKTFTVAFPSDINGAPATNSD